MSRQALIGPDPEIKELAFQRKSHPLTFVKNLWQKFFRGKKVSQEIAAAENENLVDNKCCPKDESTLQQYEHAVQNSASQMSSQHHATSSYCIGSSESTFLDKGKLGRESSLPSDEKRSSKSLEKISLESDCHSRIPESACWPWQFLVLLHRSFWLSFYTFYGLLPITQMVGFLIPCCIIWCQTPYIESFIRDRQSLLFFFPGCWGFIIIGLFVPTFPRNWLVIVRERAAGYYHLSAYVLAQVVVNNIGLMAYPSIFLAVLFPVGGLQGVGAFFATLGFFLLTCLASGALGMFFGALFMDGGKGFTMSLTVFIPTFIVGGFFLEDPSNLVAGLSVTSMLRYTYHALTVINNGPDVKFLCNPVDTSAYAVCNSSTASLNGTASLHYITGPQVVEALGFTEPMYIHVCVLLCFLVFLTLFTYLAIRVVHGRQKPV